MNSLLKRQSAQSDVPVKSNSLILLRDIQLNYNFNRIRSTDSIGLLPDKFKNKQMIR